MTNSWPQQPAVAYPPGYRPAPYPQQIPQQPIPQQHQGPHHQPPQQHAPAVPRHQSVHPPVGAPPQPRPPLPASGPLSQGAANFNWLMSSFVERTAHVDQAVVVSSDGLLMAVANIDRVAADRLSAIVTGVRSLSDGASEVLDRGDLKHVIIEMRTAYLLVSAISGGSSLGVVCAKHSDLGQVGYEMSLLVERVGAQLTPELIIELKNALTSL